MAIQVTITLSVDVVGDDFSTTEPSVQLETLANSPAQLTPYEIMPGDNYLQISENFPPTYLWIDPSNVSGASFTLKGATGDVGIPISSSMPSQIPTSQVTGYTLQEGSAGSFYAPQYQVVLTSSAQVQVPIGWF